MALPHGRRQPPLPGAIELAVTAIAVAVGVDAAMLLPRQQQRISLLRERSEVMPIRGSPNDVRPPRPQAGRYHPEWVVAINRNGWS